MASKEVLQDILQTRLSDKEFERVKCDWAAFCKNPAAYKNTVIIECVLHWLQELRGTRLSHSSCSCKCTGGLDIAADEE